MAVVVKLEPSSAWTQSLFLPGLRLCLGLLSRNACVMMQMAPDYDHLTLMQKVEVFEHAVNNTAGDDLAKLLWLKSPSSEVGTHATVWHTPLVGRACSLAPAHLWGSSLSRLAAGDVQSFVTKVKWVSPAM